MYLPLSDNRLVSIDLSKTTEKEHWKSETKFSPRQNLRIFFRQNFFPLKIFYKKKKKKKKKKKLSEKKFSDFVLAWILSQTEFGLRLNLSWTEIVLD